MEGKKDTPHTHTHTPEEKVPARNLLYPMNWTIKLHKDDALKWEEQTKYGKKCIMKLLKYPGRKPKSIISLKVIHPHSIFSSPLSC